MIKLTLENGKAHTFDGYIDGLDNIADLEPLFKGEAYLQNDEFYILWIPDTDRTDITRIVKAEFIDDNNLPTGFHPYVIYYMNNQFGHIQSIAKGYHPPYKEWEVIENSYHTFPEVVNKLIEENGLEFVFGDGFNYHNLFSLVMRECVRDILRQHDLY